MTTRMIEADCVVASIVDRKNGDVLDMCWTRFVHIF